MHTSTHAHAHADAHTHAPTGGMFGSAGMAGTQQQAGQLALGQQQQAPGVATAPYGWVLQGVAARWPCASGASGALVACSRRPCLLWLGTAFAASGKGPCLCGLLVRRLFVLSGHSAQATAVDFRLCCAQAYVCAIILFVFVDLHVCARICASQVGPACCKPAALCLYHTHPARTTGPFPRCPRCQSPGWASARAPRAPSTPQARPRPPS